MRKLLVLFLMAVSITSLSAKVVLPDIIGFVLILGAIEVVSVITFRVKK